MCWYILWLDYNTRHSLPKLTTPMSEYPVSTPVALVTRGPPLSPWHASLPPAARPGVKGKYGVSQDNKVESCPDLRRSSGLRQSVRCKSRQSCRWRLTRGAPWHTWACWRWSLRRRLCPSQTPRCQPSPRRCISENDKLESLLR